MPAPPASTSTQKAAARVPHEPSAPSAQDDNNKIVRLHITPFSPALLKVYIAPSVLPVAKNISYHTVETFPEKGFGFVELPAMEAQKLKKKLNGSTLKGSKVRIEEAKPEKRKKMEAERAEAEQEDRPAKRVKKDKKKKEDGVLEGVELPDDRKVKRGWTEVPVKGKKERKEKKDKDKDKDKDKKAKRKESKYTKEPELLFKAKLTPVAATEVARKEKKDKKEKKEKKNNKSKQEVVVHEFEKNTKTPSFLKAAKVSTDAKPAVDYINDKGWVDEDGTVIEPETTKAKKRRVKELVEPAPEDKSSKSKPKAKSAATATPPPTKSQKKKSKKVTPPPESSSSESEESSVVSSDSDSDSDSDSEVSHPTSPKTLALPKSSTPEIAITPSSPSPTSQKQIHPLEALFKKPPPSSSTSTPANPTSTPVKTLAPINTSFSFFGADDVDGDGDVDMDADAEGNNQLNNGVPFTPQTQRDIEWRGLRSAAPTPDTAAIGRRFSFPWRGGSAEDLEDVDEDEEDEDGDRLGAEEASAELEMNTRANEGRMDANSKGDGEKQKQKGKLGEVDEQENKEQPEQEQEQEESEFRKWFWENQGDLNRGWKRRRREAVKGKRNVENRRAVGGVRRKAGE